MTGFFEEAPGERSITRLAFMIMILAALYIAIYQVMTTGRMDIVSFTTVAGSAIGLKLGNRAMEAK